VTVLSKVDGLGVAPVEPPDDCCALDSKFCVAEEAGLAPVGSEHPAPFDELTPPRVPKIFRTVHRIARNREDEEDAMQDAFLLALEHFKDLDGRSAFATWFTRIAINCSLMILSQAKKRQDRFTG
jgi:DNA-directed RNA polymerase specialized sigma24 family protein